MYYIDIVYLINKTNQTFNVRLALDDDEKKIANIFVLYISLTLIGPLYKQSIILVDNHYQIDSIDFIYWHRLASVKLNTKAVKPIVSLQLVDSIYIITPVYFETNATTNSTITTNTNTNTSTKCYF